MAFESLARTLRKPFYLKHLLAAVDVLAYIFTPICSVPLIRPDGGIDVQLPCDEREQGGGRRSIGR